MNPAAGVAAVLSRNKICATARSEGGVKEAFLLPGEISAAAADATLLLLRLQDFLSPSRIAKQMRNCSFLPSSRRLYRYSRGSILRTKRKSQLADKANLIVPGRPFSGLMGLKMSDEFTSHLIRCPLPRTAAMPSSG